MGRPRKTRLKYITIETDFLRDTRIRKLRKAHGPAGVAALVALWCCVADGNGYYMAWDDGDTADMIAENNGFQVGTIKSVVGMCLQLGLFDKGLFEQEHILTGVKSQQDYLIAMRGCKGTPVIREYWLLGELPKGFVSCTKSEYFSDGNWLFSQINGDFSQADSNGINEIESSFYNGEDEKTLTDNRRKLCDRVLNHYGLITGRVAAPANKEYRKAVYARLAENYTVRQLDQVTDWACRYRRDGAGRPPEPNVIFGAKFVSYQVQAASATLGEMCSSAVKEI